MAQPPPVLWKGIKRVARECEVAAPTNLLLNRGIGCLCQHLGISRSVFAVAWIRRIKRQQPVLIVNFQYRCVMADRERHKSYERAGRTAIVGAALQVSLQLERSLSGKLRKQIAPVP